METPECTCIGGACNMGFYKAMCGNFICSKCDCERCAKNIPWECGHCDQCNPCVCNEKDKKGFTKWCTRCLGYSGSFNRNDICVCNKRDESGAGVWCQKCYGEIS